MSQIPRYWNMNLGVSATKVSETIFMDAQDSTYKARKVYVSG